MGFLKEKVILPFGTPRTVLTDSATCFTARVLQEIMKNHGIKWCRVLAYAPTWNKWVERVIRTLKLRIGRVVTKGGQEWDTTVKKVLFGYR